MNSDNQIPYVSFFMLYYPMIYPGLQRVGMLIMTLPKQFDMIKQWLSKPYLCSYISTVLTFKYCLPQVKFQGTCFRNTYTIKINITSNKTNLYYESCDVYETLRRTQSHWCGILGKNTESVSQLENMGQTQTEKH